MIHTLCEMASWCAAEGTQMPVSKGQPETTLTPRTILRVHINFLATNYAYQLHRILKVAMAAGQS